MTREEVRQLYLKHFRRNVHTPCERCKGLGHCSYSNGATYHDHSVATQAFQDDICDHCWGSGDAHSPWTNVLELERSEKDWEEEQCLKYLAQRSGATLPRIKSRFLQLADMCAKESRRRKLPDGESPFWWSMEWDMFASIFKKFGS